MTLFVVLSGLWGKDASAATCNGAVIVAVGEVCIDTATTSSPETSSGVINPTSVSNAGTISGATLSDEEGTTFRGVGIYNGESNTTGAINNSGTISASGDNTPVGIDNYGTITTLNNSNGATISADGSSAKAIFNRPFSSITTLINNGTITTSGDYAIDNDGTIGTFNNSGTIFSFNSIGTWGSIGTFTNSGSITATGLGAGGIYNGGPGTITNFTNTSSGILTGTNDYGQGFSIDGDITNLTNHGTISASGSGGTGIGNWQTGTIGTLTNTGTISATGDGVLNLGTIGTITNTGTISSTNGFGILNVPADYWEFGDPAVTGTITTLNNSQGAGNVAGALTFAGTLPTNYNIMINSPSNYGQLDVASENSWGTTTFGIYNGGSSSQGVSAGNYLAVLQGLPSGGLNNTSGTYGTQKWTLTEQATGTYDLSVIGCSLNCQGRQLRSAFNNQSVAANFGLHYDCNLFNVNGMCIALGGRYTSIDNPNINSSAAVVVLGYKTSNTIRIGAYLDQNINVSNPSMIHIGNKTPLMGAYAVWNNQADQLGYQLRLANTYQDQNITLATDAGRGTSNLNSQSYLAELSYAFKATDKLITRTYFALRNTTLKQDSYLDNNNLGYSTLKDKSGSVLMGVKLNYQLSDKLTGLGSVGVEQDFYHQVGNYQATGIDPVAFNSNIKRTRPVASVGAFYDVTKTQRASATLNYTQLPFQSTSSVTGYFNYTIGF